MKHKTLDDFVIDAIDVDDNYDVYGNTSPRSSSSDHSNASSKKPVDVKSGQNLSLDTIVEEVIRKMSLAMRHPQRQLPLQGPGAEQPMPRSANKWCAIEGKWTNHEVNECYYRPRTAGPMYTQQPPQYGNLGQPPRYAMNPNVLQGPPAEKPEPVLGRQPPPPGAAPQISIRYAQPNDLSGETLMVPCAPYFAEPCPKTLPLDDVYTSSSEMGMPLPMEDQLSMNQNT